MAGKTKTKTKTKPSVNRLYLSQGSSQGFATLTEQARPPYRAILEELLYRKKKTKQHPQWRGAYNKNRHHITRYRNVRIVCTSVFNPNGLYTRALAASLVGLGVLQSVSYIKTKSQPTEKITFYGEKIGPNATF